MTAGVLQWAGLLLVAVGAGWAFGVGVGLIVFGVGVLAFGVAAEIEAVNSGARKTPPGP